MRLRLSRIAVLWGLVVLVGWMAYRSLPVQAQGSSRGRTSGRVQLLCDLAQAIQWPKTNRTLTVALIMYTPQEVEQLSNTLARVNQAPWDGLWITNFNNRPNNRNLLELPGHGILAMNGAELDANKAKMALISVSSRTFMTVGDGYGNFTGIGGMVNLSGNLLTYNPELIQKGGFTVPQSLFSSYSNGGMQVVPRLR